MNFLFSFNNGWFIYSPLLLIIIPLGIWKLFSKDIAGALLAVFFYGITIYVFSSWWCWYYGCSFGQRPMVDFYLLIAYLIALILEGIKSLFTKILVIAAVVFTGFLNIHQSYQNFNGYIECGMATSEMYWDNFLSFQRKARVYYDDNQIISSYSFDFESKNSNCSGEVEHSEARGGEYLIFVDSEHQFSGNIEILDALFVSHPVVISAYVKAEGEINQTNLVVEHRGLSTTYRSFPLKAYVVKNEWIYMEFLYDNHYEISNDNLHVYFWNQNSSEKVYVDDLQIVILN
ncbi:MAG: hypothetical protein H6599_06315 [Flavobacteriales bacterium]|nr:hypothetical protein [Flavobacteriales bacterium]